MIRPPASDLACPPDLAVDVESQPQHGGGSATKVDLRPFKAGRLATA